MMHGARPALEMAVPATGVAGSTVAVNVFISQDNPTNVDLLLFDTNAPRNYTVSEDLKVQSRDVVTIPADVRPGTCVHFYNR